MSGIDKIASDLYKTLTESNDKKPKPYDTKAEVLRTEGDTVWVKIPGGIDETPVQRTDNANVGDTVRVRVANGRAWLVGNNTSPATDDARANIAYDVGTAAGVAANAAIDEANRAREAADYATNEAVKAEKAATSADTNAKNAKTAADTAFTNLSQVQSVLEVAQWIFTHGTYVKATVFNPNATYYTLTATQVAEPTDSDKDSEGVLIYYEFDDDIYVRTTDTSVQSGKTYYNVTGTPVSQPNEEHIADYYTLNVTEAMSDYIKSHLALTDDGLYIMKDESKWKVLVTDNGVYILDPDNKSANQMTSNGNIIGYNNKTHAKITFNSLQLSDENTTYLFISDLRNEQGIATIRQRFYGDGMQIDFHLSHIALSDDYSVKIDGVEYTGSDLTKYEDYFIFDLDNPPADGAIIIAEYNSDDRNLKAYTLGSRDSSYNIGPNSYIIGDRCGAEADCSVAEGFNTIALAPYSHAQNLKTIAKGKSQTVIGQFNKNSQDNLFEIGNGLLEEYRSNAFEVNWAGDVRIYLDRGRPKDYNIRITLNALGWNDCLT